MQSPPFPRYLVPPRSKYSPQHHVLKHTQLPSLPQCQRPSFTPIQNRQNYSWDIWHYISKDTYIQYYVSNNMMCFKIILSELREIQYIIKIYSVKLRILDWCSGLECAILYLCYGGNSRVAAVAYLECGDVVLDALVLFFCTGIISGAFVHSL